MTADSEQNKISNESLHPMGLLLSAYTQTRGGGGGDRFASALMRTLTAARMSSPYITAETDWTEKPFRFIIALETVVAGSQPTLTGNCHSRVIV